MDTALVADGHCHTCPASGCASGTGSEGSGSDPYASGRNLPVPGTFTAPAAGFRGRAYRPPARATPTPNDPADPERLARFLDRVESFDTRSWYARSRARVATGFCMTAPAPPADPEFLEPTPWADLAPGAELLLAWDGHHRDPHTRDFLRFLRDLVELRRSRPALTGEGVRTAALPLNEGVVAFHRWTAHDKRDVYIVVNLADHTRYGYRLGFPRCGSWTEVINSERYDAGGRGNAAGNGVAVRAEAGALHGFACSAPVVLPANSLLIFSRDV